MDPRLGRRGISYGKWSLKGDLVALNGLDGGRWDDGLSLWSKLWGDINWLPLDWGLLCIVSVYIRRDVRVGGAYSGCSEDVLDRLGDLWSNSVTLDQGDSVKALACELVLALDVVRECWSNWAFFMAQRPDEPREAGCRIVKLVVVDCAHVHQIPSFQ